MVGSLPLLCTERHGGVAGVGSTGGRGRVAVITRNLSGALRHDLICSIQQSRIYRFSFFRWYFVFRGQNFPFTAMTLFNKYV